MALAVLLVLFLYKENSRFGSYFYVTDLNTITKTAHGYCNNCVNSPIDANGYIEVTAASNLSGCFQRYTTYNNSKTYIRQLLSGGVWTDWEKGVTNSDFAIKGTEINSEKFTSNFVLKRSGNIVAFSCNSDVTSIGNGTNLLTNIPNGYKPISTVKWVASPHSSNFLQFNATPAGELSVYNYNGELTSLTPCRFYITWITNDNYPS